MRRSCGRYWGETMWNVFVVKADASRGTFQQVLTPLSLAEMNRIGGLPPQAIAGVLGKALSLNELEAITAPDGGKLDYRQFRVNPRFLFFLHEVLGTHGPSLREMSDAAQKKGAGSVAIIDLRTKNGPGGDVPAVDVIGWYRVADGKIIGYDANRAYVLFSERGPMQLSQPLAALFRKELLKLRV